MDEIEFLSYVEDNIELLLISFFISLLLLIPVIRKYNFHIINPYVIHILLSIFANSVPLFLFFVGIISVNTLIYIIICEVCFWAGFCSFLKKKRQLKFSIQHQDHVCEFVFYLFTASYILITLYSYIAYSVPLFLDSRMAMYVESNGGGLLSRIQPMLLIYSVYYIFEKVIIEKKTNLIYYICIIVFIIFGILSGSKSSFLSFVFCYYFLCLRYSRKIFSLKMVLTLVPIAIITASIGFVLKSDEGAFYDGFIIFLFRFIASGDVYYYSLPYDTFNSVHVNSPILYLASQFLVPARVLPITSLEDGTGYQLYWLIHPESISLLSGPNSRIPFLSYVLFKEFGVLFSLFAGLFSSFIIYMNKYLFSGNNLFYPFYIFCSTQLVFFIYDFSSGIGQLFSISVCFVILLFVIYSFNSLLFIIYRKNEVY